MAHEFYGGLSVADVEDLPDQLAQKSATSHPHSDLSPRPFSGVIPSGSATPVVTHNLGTTDVDVEVIEFSTNTCVGVPTRRTGPNTVEFTFSTAPTTGQYVCIVSVGAGRNEASVSSVAAHASHHATSGDDPLNPADINAAPTSHTHSYAATSHTHDGYQPWGPLSNSTHTHSYLAAGSYAAPGHSHTGFFPSGGTTSQLLCKNTATDLDFVWRSAATDIATPKAYSPIEVPVTITSGIRYYYCNITQGTHFRVTMDTETSYVAFSGTPVPGQVVLVEVTNPQFTSSPNPFEYLRWYPLYTVSPIIEMSYPMLYGNGDTIADRVYLGRTNIYTWIFDERAARPLSVPTRVNSGQPGGVWRQIGRVPDFSIVPEDYSVGYLPF